MLLGIVYKVILLICTVKAYLMGRKSGFSAQDFLFFYLLVTLICEMSSFELYFINPNIKVGLLYHSYSVFSLAFFGWYFYKKSWGRWRLFPVLTFLAALLAIVTSSKFYDSEFDYRVGVYCSVFFVLNAVFWFFQKLNSDGKEQMTDFPDFWISTGFLLWGCFFIFRVIPMFLFEKMDKEFLIILRTILNTINIIMYSLFYVALLKYQQKKEFALK